MQFEAELLSNIKINSKEDANKCLDELHSKGPDIVVISSTNTIKKGDVLIGFVSKRIKKDDKSIVFERYEIEMPQYNAHFVGTGDLFSSIFLVWLTKTKFDVKQSMENAIATLQNVLKNTVEYAEKRAGGLNSTANIELRLVQNKKHLESPVVELKCRTIL